MIGRVRSIGPIVTVEKRDGQLTSVPHDAVLAWRVVPDRPARSRAARSIGSEQLARITSLGWPAVESEALGDWELRASGGFTGRANSVLVTGDPGRPLDDAIAHVTDFYTRRGLAPVAQTIVGSAGDDALTERGWRPVDGPRPGAIVQIADLRHPPAADPEVIVATELDDAWMALYPRIEEQRVEAARSVLSGPHTVGFASIGSPAIAIGRVVVTGEWAGLAAVEVRPEHRRQGSARRIVETTLAWAAARGADKAYLQTTRDNTAALALYEPFGFATHHEYRYLTPA